MKRGLKGTRKIREVELFGRCRVFPDEEGTESSCFCCAPARRYIVAEYSPMKRGLKGRSRSATRSASFSVAEYSPMKRGLKDGSAGEVTDHPKEELQSIPR